MKIILKSLVLLILVLLTSCGGGKDDDSSPETVKGSLGTFAGNIQVTDDPQTDLGYIFNSKVKVDRNAANVEVQVVGDLGFNREFQGTIDSESEESYIIKLRSQSKPSEKTISGNVVINGNELGITIDILDDKVNLKENQEDEDSFEISGKISMIGGSMIRE